MEFTNETLVKIHTNKERYNTRYARYFYRLSQELHDNTYLNRARNIDSCLDYWKWNKYEKNKILDLQLVNRCKNTRFCPNCKKLDVSKFIHKFKEIVIDYSEYNYYFLTLTVPNCNADDLNKTLDKINDSFAKLKEKLSYDLISPSGRPSKKAFHERLVKFDGGIRVLEINYNGYKGYHPHLHCVVLCKDAPFKRDLTKHNLARYSKKRKSIDVKSNIEVRIGKLWSMIWYNEEISLKRYNEINYLPSMIEYEPDKKVLEVDFTEFNEKGIYEVFKYTMKDKDIVSYSVFKTLYFALLNRRVRQSFGCLYNVKVDDFDIGEQQELILEFEEDGCDILTKSIKELFTTYKDYKKISRFDTIIDNNIK